MPRKAKKRVHRKFARKKARIWRMPFIPRPFIYILIGFVLTGLASQITVISAYQPAEHAAVLGEGSEEKQEEQKREEERKGEEEKKNEEQRREELMSKDSSGRGSGEEEIKIRTQDGKTEREIKTATGQEYKFKSEDDGKMKVEARYGDIKVRYESKDGELSVTGEDDDGDEVELEDDDIAELEDELAQDDVHIGTTSGSKMTLRRHDVTAVSQFPLSLDLETGSLVVTTPAGVKTVAFLPDQALARLALIGLFDTIATDSVLTDTNTEIRLTVRGDSAEYEIDGTRKHKLLGFWPMETRASALVSAQTGEVTAVKESILARLVDLLSF